MNTNKHVMSNTNLIEADQQRKYSLLRSFFTLSLLVHIFLIVLWFHLKFFELLFVHFLGFCIFTFNLFLIRKKKYLLSLQIGIASIVVASCIASYFLGWESFFSVYLIASAIIIINSLSIQLNWKIFEVLLILILFIGSLIFTSSGSPIYILDSKLLNRIGLSNVLVTLFAIFLMEFQNFIENDKFRRKIEEISDIDPLTGVYNRRFFNKYLAIEIKRLESQLQSSSSREVNFGIAMIDIDDFKNVNDKYGHLVGDAVIVEVAEIIKAVIFKRDIFCRYGGEEFVVLFTSTSKPAAMRAVEKILRTVEDYEFTINREHSKIKIPITVSIGFACFGEETNIFRLLDIADKRLYTAKQRGKNRAVFE